jgi:hypothetical protein
VLLRYADDREDLRGRRAAELGARYRAALGAPDEVGATRRAASERGGTQPRRTVARGRA